MRYVKDLRLSSMLKNRLDVYGVVTATEKNRLGQYPKDFTNDGWTIERASS